MHATRQPDLDLRAVQVSAPAIYSQDAESTYGLLCTEPGCPQDIPSTICW